MHRLQLSELGVVRREPVRELEDDEALLEVASSSILPSSMTAPVPSPIASLTRRACATSSALGQNTLGDGDLAGCRVHVPTQPSRKALRTGPRTRRRRRCRRTGRSRGRCRASRRRRPCARSCSATGPAGRWPIAVDVAAAGPAARGSRGARRHAHRLHPRSAARSAGPRLMPCIRGLAPAISSTFATPAPSRGSRGPGAAGSGRRGPRAGRAAVEVMDILGALHLGHHDHVDPVADLGDQGREVVEDPRESRAS